MQISPSMTASEGQRSRSALAAVLRILPQLTYFGLGLYERGAGLSPAAYAEKFRAKQDELLDDGETFVQVCDWLDGIAPRQAMSYGSYYLKHVCENRLGTYVANGTFIAAAVHGGFPYQLIPGSPNVRFGMSKRSIHRAWTLGGPQDAA